jgi:hypothetical protein
MDKKDLTKKYLSEVARDEKWISSRLMKIKTFSTIMMISEIIMIQL